MIRRLRTLIVGTTFCLVIAAGAQPPSSSSAQAIQQSTRPAELVGRVVENELNAKDEGHFQYRRWRQTTDGTRVKEVVETAAGTVDRLVAVDGQPLTAKQQAKEDTRLHDLLLHPERQQQHQKEQRQDDETERMMFRELPVAFLYEYAGTERGQWGELICLRFVPNPNYQPPSRETSVYKAMSGKLWVALPEYRLARIEATLFQEVRFGWGILGHLDKGGHFYIEQSKIGPSRWDVTYQDIQFDGKALLFKTICLHEVEKTSEFRSVPESLSLAAGIEMLKEGNRQIIASSNQR
jgi:hypothetical protein